MHEAEVCTKLRRAAVSVAELPTGIVIDLRPTERASWQSLQDATDDLAAALGPPARVRTAVGLGRGCDLPDLAAHGARVRVEHAEEAIRIHLTTDDQNDIDRLRHDARELAEELQPAPPLEPPI